MSSERVDTEHRSPSPHRCRRARPWCAGLGAIALALSSCTTSGVVDTDDLVQLIEVDLAGQLGIEITGIECPTVTDPDVGDRATCTEVIDGQSSEFTITFTDVDDLTASVTNADAIFRRDDLPMLVAEEFAAAGATAVEVACIDPDTPGTEYLIVRPGTAVDCDVVLDDGQEVAVRVDVIDNTGVVDLSIVG